MIRCINVNSKIWQRIKYISRKENETITNVINNLLGDGIKSYEMRNVKKI